MSGTTYTARKMHRRDMSAVVMLSRRLHEESEWAFLTFSPAAMRKSLDQILRRPDYEVFVAEDAEGNLTGLLIGSVDQVIYGRATFATDVEFAANGGGDELLDEFRNWAVAKGVSVIVMGVSNSGREAAKDRFFRKHGMERSGGMYQEKIK